MATARILQPPRTVDPYYHQAERLAEMERRIAMLESGANARLDKHVLNVSGVSSCVLVPDFDGENCGGVRVTFTGRTASGPTTLWLRPNNLTSMSGQAIIHRAWSDSTAFATDVAGNLAITTLSGLTVAMTDFGVANSGLHFEGVFLCSRLGGVHHRKWLGQYFNTDYDVSSSREVGGAVRVLWADPSTNVSSLVLTASAGTFSGRIVVELLP